MTRKQAINYLKSSGMTYQQIREIVEALSRPYRGTLRVGDVVYANPIMGVVTATYEDINGEKAAHILFPDGATSGVTENECLKTGCSIQYMDSVMIQLGAKNKEEQEDGE